MIRVTGHKMPETTQVPGTFKVPGTYLRRLLKPLVSTALLAFLLTQIELDRLGQALAGARWLGVGLALTLFVLGILIRAYRWQVFLNALGLRVPLRTLSAWYFVGSFFNTVLPTGFGGDAVKAAELARYSGRGAAAVGTVLVDRFLGIVVLLAMGAVVLPLAGSGLDRRLTGLVAALFLACVSGFWLLRRQRLVRWAGRLAPRRLRQTIQRPAAALYEALQGYSRPTLAHALLVSFLFNVVWIAVNAVLGWALGIQATLVHYLVFVPLVSLSLLLPSVGGLGVRELTYVGLFGLIGVPEEKAFALGILVYAVMVATGLIGGVIYLVQGAQGK